MLEFGHHQLSQIDREEDFPILTPLLAPSFRPLTWRKPAPGCRITEIDWFPDLGQSVGSLAWFRGAATLIALTLMAFSFWPRFDWAPSRIAGGAQLVGNTPAKSLAARSVAPAPARLHFSQATADPVPLRLRGRAGDSLFSAASAAGAPGAVIQSYLGILSGQLGVEFDLQPDDIFDLVIARQRTAQGDVQLGDLLYAGLERAGRKRAGMLRWGTDGAFIAAGSHAQSPGAELIAGFARPIDGAITSGFGLRMHPVLGMVRMHSGIDYGSAWGTPVHAAAAGTVSFAAPRGGYGNYVRIDHGGGIASGYGHLSFISVAPGATVQPGQLIGLVGSSGLSTGPHLHFEMFRDGVAVNPKGLPFPAAKVGPTLEGSQQAAFAARLAALMALSPAADPLAL